MRSLTFAFLLVLAGCNKDKEAEKKPADAPSASAAAPAEPPAPKADDQASLTAPFEGEIDMTMKMATMPAPMNVTYAVKADKARFDVAMPGVPKMWVLFDAKENKSWAVLDAQKTMMVTDANKPAPGAKQVEWKAKRTGKSDTVAGQRCEIWTLEGEKDQLKGQPAQRYEVCVVKKASNFNWLKLAGAQSNTHFAWSPELEREQAVPLRTVGFDEAGKETVRVETTRFERKSIDDARLQLPKGYRTVAAPPMPALRK